MDNIALFSISGNKWHCFAAVVIFGMFSSVVCVASIVMLLGSFTFIPGAHFLVFVQCVLKPKKVLCTLSLRFVSNDIYPLCVSRCCC